MSKVRVVVAEDDDIYGKEFNLLSYQRAVQEWVDAVPAEFRADAVIVYDGGGDYPYVGREVAYYRPETAADIAKRMRLEEEWKSEHSRRELAEYERLKAKYGSAAG